MLVPNSLVHSQGSVSRTSAQLPCFSNEKGTLPGAAKGLKHQQDKVSSTVPAQHLDCCIPGCTSQTSAIVMMISSKQTLATRGLCRRTGAVQRPAASCRSRVGSVQVKALMTPPQQDDKNKKRFITREEEPDQYWSSKGEREGANTWKDPVTIGGLIFILFPFAFLLVLIATGAIDLSVYKS